MESDAFVKELGALIAALPADANPYRAVGAYLQAFLAKQSASFNGPASQGFRVSLYLNIVIHVRYLCSGRIRS